MKSTKLEKAIFEMLTENTGNHFLDSGDHYGRNHERNAKKTIEDFRNESPVSYTKENDYIDRRVSVFHYILSMGLELDEICNKFNKINKDANDWDANAEVYGVSGKAWEVLTAFFDVKILRTFNTYNHDSDLSQVLQGSWLEIEGESYLLLQIHGGCDVRGGYTNARLFKYDENESEFLPEYMSQEEILEELEGGYITL
jgi:hypothetical protein